MINLLSHPSSALHPDDLPKVEVRGLYVHIPFCFHKCHYCDFYSITRQTDDRMNHFVDLMLKEADQWIHSREGPTPRPRTVFFGGGTPTLLPLSFMQRLISGLCRRFDFAGVEEWTVEANPATVTLEYCEMLRDAGVDRLSFGAQSFSPSELAMLERHHDPEDVPRSISIARQAGFRRLNLDLIYAIPGQDLASWSKSLEAAIALETSHLSCYGLTYEPNTAMAVRRRLGQFQGAEESLELEMFHHTRRRLAQAGRPAYEISNFAAPGQECRHNLLYWTGGDYIGLGPSAASHVRGWRWRNRPHLGEWEQAIGMADLPAIDIEHLSAEQRGGELAMLLLRLTSGLKFDAFADRAGLDARVIFADQMDRLASMGLLIVDATGLRLSERGLNVADAVAAEFLQTSAPHPSP